MEVLAALMAGASAAWERRRGPCGCRSCRDQHGQAEHEPKQQRLLLGISLLYPISETWRREKVVALPLSPMGLWTVRWEERWRGDLRHSVCFAV